MLKLFKAFFNYLNKNLDLNVGFYHHDFFAKFELIPVLVLTPKRLNFLIANKEFENSLDKKLRKFKDMFVFGCTVATRFSDLTALEKSNVEIESNVWYLSVRAQKTGIFTRIKLPPYAIEIIKRQNKSRKKLFPFTTLSNFNLKIKLIALLAGWTGDRPKTRAKRGVSEVIYRDPEKKLHFRFCDLLSSHSMRKTTITTLIRMGMKEGAVRKISGHAPNSAEFHRYVEYAQAFLDAETDQAFKKLTGQ